MVVDPRFAVEDVGAGALEQPPGVAGILDGNDVVVGSVRDRDRGKRQG